MWNTSAKKRLVLAEWVHHLYIFGTCSLESEYLKDESSSNDKRIIVKTLFLFESATILEM